jgi:hypothetical protein
VLMEIPGLLDGIGDILGGHLMGDAYQNKGG